MKPSENQFVENLNKIEPPIAPNKESAEDQPNPTLPWLQEDLGQALFDRFPHLTGEEIEDLLNKA
jgi:hypothetical protein